MLSARAKRRRLARGDEHEVARASAATQPKPVPTTPVESMPAHKMILGRCVHCHGEVEASSLRDGRCLACRVGDAVAAHRDEYVRLRRKQNALRAANRPSGGTDQQVGRCLRRMWLGVQALVPDRRLASTLMEKAMREFEVAVVSSSGLYVPEAALRKAHPLSRRIAMPTDNQRLAPLVAAR